MAGLGCCAQGLQVREMEELYSCTSSQHPQEDGLTRGFLRGQSWPNCHCDRAGKDTVLLAQLWAQQDTCHCVW